MRGINEVRLIGHCGKAPSLNPNRTAAMVSVCTNEEWTDDNGDKKQKDEWHTVQFYGKLAAVADDLIKKGSHIYIEGKNQTEKWQGNDGFERQITKVVVQKFLLLDKKPK